ncbi:type VI secretion system contractile sheath small subunit [Ectothiorhodospira variabilis]|uniref:type VI secretion system contractile sheath small subunit n=1 Tax=Ectothiorhodospira variabilis TaxID=505694 RepID=UPI001EFB91B4|nr:type VI secretion system contractile sheath small subunit [Ectothiorhodospira variabilis]MCG5494991.1 type VI secretion system contractile sheath small subunit [Ectothiorhodospira variabilis]MCG5504504.1 type VI secretion system contractile sheath small subunit [Ectothiorhodospira variabilis]MCG5507630.1 type VI secretion system contractile sheath small subunit [Ectothiorhodospira variabilis]
MTRSFQNEVPRARVNIALEVNQGGGRRKVDLPFKMLVMGDFSHGRAQGRVAERPRTVVHSGNLQAVLKDMAPSLRFTVPDRISSQGQEIPVDLTFEHMKDFSPEAVAARVPSLARLMAMRNLLKELKSSLLDNAALRRELDRIVRDDEELKTLQGQLKRLLPPAEASSQDTTEH